MRNSKKGEDSTAELKPEFQHKLFNELFKKYDRGFLVKKLNRTSSMLYHYKNNRNKSVSLAVVKKACKLAKISSIELSKNVLRVFSLKDSILKIMNEGAKIGHKYQKDRLTVKVGATSLLEQQENLCCLNVLDWIQKNNWVENIGKQNGLIKKAKLEELTKEKIKISYLVYNKRTKKCEPYNVFLPPQLFINEDFSYFLGLLYGDGLSGARVGIVNKDKAIIKWVSDFLNLHLPGNKTKGQLFLYKKINKVNIQELYNWLKSVSNESEVYNFPKGKGSYVFNIFMTNNILRRILDDFLFNLRGFFQKLTFRQKGAFLAGFFDAEGNVNKLDKNFRFSQKIEIKVKAIKEILENEGYHTRYDGGNILIGYKTEFKNDLNLFEKQIFPFLKHSSKTPQAGELLQGFLVREEYKPILKIIFQNSGVTQKEISTIIGRVKCHAKLKALLASNFVKRERNQVDESFKYSITDEGLKYLGET